MSQHRPTSPRLLRADPADHAAFSLAIDEGAAVIRRGGLVAFPTETVYGLGADAMREESVRRIFVAKGRPRFNPLIVHLADASELPRVARTIPEAALVLARDFWPGALTMVLPRMSDVPDAVTAGLDGVGVRVPAHAVARALIERSGVPIAAPSANAYTRVSPTTAAHVLAQLAAEVDLVLDGGPSSVGIESTVLDLTGARAVLLRLGGITREALERVIGPVDDVRQLPFGDAPRPSPGMDERHYAPRAQLHPFAAHEREEIWRHIAERSRGGEVVGVLAFDTTGVKGSAVVTMPRDSAGYARALYAALHALDASGCRDAYVENIPAGEGWDAVADRLRRAGLRLVAR